MSIPIHTLNAAGFDGDLSSAMSSFYVANGATASKHLLDQERQFLVARGVTVKNLQNMWLDYGLSRSFPVLNADAAKRYFFIENNLALA